MGWLVGGTAVRVLIGSFLLLAERKSSPNAIELSEPISYLPVETARRVAFESPSSLIQAERRNVTLLSADLRNFSAIGERRPPEESAAILHYFFTKVSQIVESHGGRVH